MSRPWVFGNTTIRNPLRMHDALAALIKFPEACPRKGREHENAFAHFLYREGIVNITRADADVSDLGRKWRSGLVKLGFLFPEESATPFAVTGNGRRLAEAEPVATRQECFLRALSSCVMPSVIESDYTFRSFYPFRYVLAIALQLQKFTGSSFIHELEMAGIIQFSTAKDSIPRLCKEICGLRKKRSAAKHKRPFDRMFLEKAAKKHGYKPSTPGDYSDTNLRYLKATGLFCTQGHGIVLVAHKQAMAELLAVQPEIPATDADYITRLTQGVPLPTDDEQSARNVLAALCKTLHEKKIPFLIDPASLITVADVNAACHQADDLLTRALETEFAAQQVKFWPEIAQYMRLLASRTRKKMLPADDDDAPIISIPDTEQPAYLEWVLWRAFLAINSLKNAPHEARRFAVDVDFLPVSTAPGNGPDMVFEFDDYLLVVEVTLTESSRQEACEGEPVRRHVADYLKGCPKLVYGLFVAAKIDTNTAETFRVGTWHYPDDSRVQLGIVPMTLTDFEMFFTRMFTKGKPDARHVQDFLITCLKRRDAGYAPDWKRAIQHLSTADACENAS